jgi:aspartate racemase
MIDNSIKKVLGVLGGIGPLASAEFVRTIYEYSKGDFEQATAAVMLYSDPGFPDRNQMFLQGKDDLVLSSLVDALDRLCAMGSDKIVICCVTMHHLLSRLPSRLRERIISVLDVIFDMVEAMPGKHLVVCSVGTHRLNILKNHPRWASVAERLVFPTLDDQEELQRLIFEIKMNRGMGEMIAFLESLLRKHEVESFVVGCSEIHIIAKLMSELQLWSRTYGCLDPLAVIAKDCAEGRLWAANRSEHLI